MHEHNAELVKVLHWVILAPLLATILAAQTTQGIISGRVFDTHTGEGISGARINFVNPATGAAGVVVSNNRGYYALPFLSPGNYRLRAEQEQFQAREIYGLVLYVAERLELNFPLRPLNQVWEAGRYSGVFLPDSGAMLPFVGPDLETGRSSPLGALAADSATLQSSVSYVIDPQQLGNLPLASRQVYTMLLTLPGVTADHSTGRGLGLAVNGQRPSASNFLLDGIENNDYLITGPFSPVAPEAMQEYRISTNNFSAEFGRTSGFIANAITSSGTNSFHGLIYGYLNNENLNANTFQRNANAGFPFQPRLPQHQLQLGFSAGGPIRRDRLFFSSGFERFRHRSEQGPEDFLVPVPQRFRECSQAHPDGPEGFRTSLDLLTRFPPPEAQIVPSSSGSPCENLLGLYTGNRDVSLDRTLAIGRLDYRSPSGAHRLLGRMLVSRLTQPDFFFSVYEDFNTPLRRNSYGAAFSYLRSFGPDAMNELRFGWRNAHLGLVQSPAANFSLLVLQLISVPGGLEIKNVELPGNGTGVNFDFVRDENNWEINDSLVITKGRHVMTLGGGLLLRRFESLFSFGRDPIYGFRNTLDFALSRPQAFLTSVSRQALRAGELVPPDYERSQSNNQFFGFFQDSVKVTTHLGLNLGVRYESFGSPLNTGTQDGYLSFPQGPTIEERLAGATLTFDDNGSRPPYRADRNNWAGRLGLSYNFFGGGRTVFRAAYGIFYDRLFDNLTLPTRINNLSEDRFQLDPNSPFDYTQPVANTLAGMPTRTPGSTQWLWVDDNLRTPYVQSWVASIQQRFSPDFQLEIDHLGSVGRKLIATDFVNRLCSSPSCVPTDATKLYRLNADLNDVLYRSNSGSSSYTALAAVATYRSRKRQFRISYTYSHSIDNQSDPLSGTGFLNLCFINPDAACAQSSLATFTRQFDSRGDRGNSDFDQRHNLVFYSLWELGKGPRFGWMGHVLGGWQLAQLAGIRSGFPYTVYVGDTLSGSGVLLKRNRPNLLPGVSPELDRRTPVRGGLQILDPKAFGTTSQLGNLGRNSLIGPGFWNIDCSLAKSFPLLWLGESGRLQFRADFFNVLNHANLRNPVPLLGSANFGQTLYGPDPVESAFPALTPLGESPRQVQLQIKIYF